MLRKRKISQTTTNDGNVVMKESRKRQNKTNKANNPTSPRKSARIEAQKRGDLLNYTLADARQIEDLLLYIIPRTFSDRKAQTHTLISNVVKSEHEISKNILDFFDKFKMGFVVYCIDFKDVTGAYAHPVAECLISLGQSDIIVTPDKWRLGHVEFEIEVSMNGFIKKYRIKKDDIYQNAPDACRLLDMVALFDVSKAKNANMISWGTRYACYWFIFKTFLNVDIQRLRFDQMKKQAKLMNANVSLNSPTRIGVTPVDIAFDAFEQLDNDNNTIEIVQTNTPGVFFPHRPESIHQTFMRSKRVGRNEITSLVNGLQKMRLTPQKVSPLYADRVFSELSMLKESPFGVRYEVVSGPKYNYTSKRRGLAS
jgi:hypothetical protein